MSNPRPSRPFAAGNQAAVGHGRPPATIPKSAHAAVTKLAAKGVRVTDIARACGVSYQTFRRIRETDDALQAAVDAGRQLMHDKLIGELYRRAVSRKQTNPAYLLFAIKALFNYRDAGPADAAAEQKQTVIINLPAPHSPEAYRNAITIDANEPADDAISSTSMVDTRG